MCCCGGMCWFVDAVCACLRACMYATASKLAGVGSNSGSRRLRGAVSPGQKGKDVLVLTQESGYRANI